MDVVPGLINFKLYESAQLVSAYTEASRIVVSCIVSSSDVTMLQTFTASQVKAIFVAKFHNFIIDASLKVLYIQDKVCHFMVKSLILSDSKLN